MKNDIFHILNRGVEKRKIFSNHEDYIRFIYNLYDFNNANIVFESYSRRKQKHLSRLSGVALPTNRNKLVDILCWCLMPNHIHILALEKINKGTSEFSRKIIVGYTNYFNKINNRSGVLFQGRTKIIPVKRNKHFLCLPFYIMANPLALLEPTWKEKGLKNCQAAFKFLKKYQYSSLSDILDDDNLISVINKKLFFELFETNPKQFQKDFIEWLNMVGSRTPDTSK
ncbi:MAG: hypothetical protein ABII94_01285 [Patescibacteria group bacterium]|nr:hypothetical protein [Patescibacteria group bacterium]MBU1349620.1 hypothetical protein [Patescibacteria group bacterium]MBU1956626.1 hypothetical protein [Patescibacteria group bacterium]MBU2415677.1 hypothetical protein [Patescibacteria group bacterium]